MSTYYYGPALESELDYRRSALQHFADADRLARQARGSGRAVRAARRLVPGSRTHRIRPAARAA